MEFLGPLHPLIVHVPVALLVFSAFLALVGRLFDRDWVRRAGVLLLVFGFLGAWAAVLSGEPASHVPEDRQGVPEARVATHEDAAYLTLWTALAAIVALGLGARLPGGAGRAAATLGFVLQLAAAVFVGITGYRGGRLVYENGANVKINGRLLVHPGFVPHTGGEHADHDAK